MPPSPPIISSNSPISISLSNPSSINNYLSILFDVNKNKKEKRELKDHPLFQIIDNNFNKRLTRIQANEIDQIITIFRNLYMFGDKDDGEPKGQKINYALISTSKFINFEPSYFDQACKKKVWMQAMQEDINGIIKSDTWELYDFPKGRRCVGP